jgi:flagellar biogenesis protein FliO
MLSIAPLLALVVAAAGYSEPAAIPLAPARHESALPLGAAGGPGQPRRDKPVGSLTAMVTVGSSLAVVLGLFFLVAWAVRRGSPGGSMRLPGEVFEVLGHASLGGRQQVHLLRCGSKLLLVSITPAGTETLTEVTDLEEADRLAALCRRTGSPGAAAALRQAPRQEDDRV